MADKGFFDQEQILMNGREKINLVNAGPRR
jgi:hypothetical protein